MSNNTILFEYSGEMVADTVFRTDPLHLIIQLPVRTEEYRFACRFSSVCHQSFRLHVFSVNPLSVRALGFQDFSQSPFVILT